LDGIGKVFDIEIRASREDVWAALTKPEETRLWHNGLSSISIWKPGVVIRHIDDQGRVRLNGRIIEVRSPERLAYTFHFVDGQPDPPSRLTWELEQVGTVCRLRLTHDGFVRENETYRTVVPGWPPILERLRAVVERPDAP
jgi:uncharacterized protein YndB with AHSA1/START domain